MKKILECICVNCGKLKADIVSACSPRVRLHPHHPNFLGALPVYHGKPRARGVLCSAGLNGVSRVFGRLIAARPTAHVLRCWVCSCVVKWGAERQYTSESHGLKDRPILRVWFLLAMSVKQTELVSMCKHIIERCCYETHSLYVDGSLTPPFPCLHLHLVPRARCHIRCWIVCVR